MNERLINSNHNVDETKVKLQSLLKLWSDLKALSEQIRKELQDALDLYNFETEIDEIEATVREKEYMSNVSDIGKDLEHCKDLLHKLSETDAEMNVHEKFERALRLAKKVEGSKMSADADKAHIGQPQPQCHADVVNDANHHHPSNLNFWHHCLCQVDPSLMKTRVCRAKLLTDLPRRLVAFDNSSQLGVNIAQ